MGQMVCLVREDVAEGHFWPFYYCEAWLKRKKEASSLSKSCMKLYEMNMEPSPLVSAAGR